MNQYDLMAKVLANNIENTRLEQVKLQGEVRSIRAALVKELGDGFDENLLSIKQKDEHGILSQKCIPELKQCSNGYMDCLFILAFPNEVRLVEAKIELQIQLEGGYFHGKFGSNDFNDGGFTDSGQRNKSLVNNAVKEITLYVEDEFVI